ncbi:unnamed protein product [Fraxinus pennsylvanica]|uniref:Uncharacterized protein n=1 Tax=Fraxinus pennsylvanica TaxID=56036 RepID=A0AAD2EDC0_9LAMI|nr:unnamed protein product [Fraxinus pennsylvanica]
MLRKDKKQETWLSFQGLDIKAKQEIVRELVKIVFGSYSNYVAVNLLSSFSSTTREDSVQRFAQEVTANPHRVFFIQDLEHTDYCSKTCIKMAIKRGRIGNADGEEVSLCDAIVILSSESIGSRTCSSFTKQKSDESMAEKDESINDQDRGLLENVDRCSLKI